MSLIHWRNKNEIEPRSDEHALTRLRNEIASVFDRFFNDPLGTSALELLGGPGDRFSGPRVELSATDAELTARVELPGIDPKDLDIRLGNGVLTLRGEKRAQRDEKCGECVYTEREFGAFSRSIPLPASVDADAVDATYQDGVLTVTLKKSPATKAKKVAVRDA